MNYCNKYYLLQKITTVTVVIYLSTNVYDEHKFRKGDTASRSNNYARKMSVKMRTKLYVLETIPTTARSILQMSKCS